VKSTIRWLGPVLALLIATLSGWYLRPLVSPNQAVIERSSDRGAGSSSGESRFLADNVASEALAPANGNQAVPSVGANGPEAVSQPGSVDNGSKSPEVVDSTRMATDPLYAARVRRHVHLRAYHQSPAKNTPEARQVVDLLAKHGVGIEGVMEAYGAAMEIHEQQQRVAAAPSAERGHHEIVLQMMAGEIAQRLPRKYGIEDPQFLIELFQIKPTVFFGRFDPVVYDGEILLEE
jgi:hypothetical protein